jgi:ferric-chelate reductase
MRFFVTCLCDPEAVQAIPNSEISMEKPSISNMLEESFASMNSGPGGVGVAASGPEGLVAEARNSVAKLGARAARMGGIALHTEVFCL